MTSPNQSAPDGAVTVGGGEFRFGSQVDENRARETFEIEPPSNLAEALDLLPSVLSMLPGDSMRPWQKWFGASDEERADGTVVQNLLDSLSKRPLKSLLDNLWDGFKGTTGSEDKTPADVLAAAQEIASNVSTALTNAGQATSNADSALDAAYDILAAGSNLIANSDFEKGVSGQPLQGVFSDEVSYSGVKSLKMTSNGSGKSYDLLSGGLTPRTIPADAGDIFLLDAYVYGKADNVQTSGAPTGVRLSVTPYNRFGVALTDAYVSLPADATTRGVWTKMTAFVTMPPNTAKVKLSLQLTGEVDGDEVYYFDLVTVREVTLAKQASNSATNAEGTASSAQTTATNAQVTAGNAQTTANNAQSAADNAQVTADNAELIVGDVIETGTNLIVNPSFEKGWFAQGAGTYSTEQARTGTRSLKIMATGLAKKFTFLSDDTNFKFIPVTGGDTFYVEVWVRGKTSNTQISGGAGGIVMMLEPFYGLTELTNSSVSLTASTALNGVWTKLSGYITVPSNASRIRMSLGFTNAVDSGEVYYFDDACVREVSLASTANSNATSAQASATTASSNADLALVNATDAADLAGQVVESGSNLIANSDFEKGLIATQPSVGVYTTDQKYSGSRSLRIQANGTTKTYYLLSQGLTPRTIPGEAGDKFYCCFYVYGDTITSTVSDGIRLVFEPVDRWGANLTDSYVGYTVSTALNNVWTKVEAYLTLPANTAKFRVSLQVRSTVTSGFFYFDQIICREVTLAHSAAQTSSSALSTANTASTNASAAQTSANTAQSTANSANSTANTATTNLQTTIDGVVQAVDGGSATGNAPATAKTKLQLAWARIFDGMYGNALGTNTSKVTSDMHTAGSALRSATTTAQTSATNANTAASTAQGTANTATANLQTTIDGVVQAVDGSTATGAGAAATKTKLQLAWARIFDGMYNNASGTNTAKSTADLHTAGAALRSAATTAQTSATGAQTTANTVTTNHGTLVDNVTKSFLADETLSGTSLTDALAAMKKAQADLDANTKAIQTLQTAKDSFSSGGTSFAVDFGNFASMAAAGFTVLYSGAGASTIGISGGVAQWTVADSSPRDAKIIYNSSTNTDFQSVRGTMTAPPQVPSGTTPYFYAIARVSADGLNYVWARAYAQSLGVYKADMGYCVGGVETTWVSNISLTWSLDMRFVAGIGTNARQYQIWSGNKVVYTYNEVGTSSQLGVNNRRWGAIAQVRNGKVAGKVSACSATDTGTPSVNGSTARMSRESTALVSFPAGESVLSTLFDKVDYESLDVDADTATGTFTVKEAKPYLISARVKVSTAITGWGALILQVYDSSENIWGSSTIIPWNGSTGWKGLKTNPAAQWGDSCSLNAAGMSLHASWVQYLNVGDKVRLASYRSSGSSNELTGSALGRETYFSIASAEGAG